MKNTLLLILSLLVWTTGQSQNGTADDFTVTDINGETHNLYNILDGGKIVILDAAAAWCGSCWSVHESHLLEEVYAVHGPEGTDLLEIIFYEVDASTTLSDLEGTGDRTLGDWITGVTYPIVNESPLSLSSSTYWPYGFPAVNVIRPSDREIIGNLWYETTSGLIEVIDDLIISEGLLSATAEELLAQEIKLSPSLATDLVTISTELSIQKLEVVNSMGQLMQAISSPEFPYQLDVNALNAGVHFIRMHTMDGRQSINKFIRL